MDERGVRFIRDDTKSSAAEAVDQEASCFARGDCVRGGYGGEFEWWNAADDLAFDAERFAARHHDPHLRTAMEQTGDHRRGGFDEVLGVVEHQQGLLAAHAMHDPIHQAGAPPALQPDHGSDLVHDTDRIRHGAEIHPVHSVELTRDR